jgi:imidazoleglycerol-phosphate dehydratase
MRKVSLSRTTKETAIQLNLNLDGVGEAKIDTGIGFFDHMLTLMCFHSKIDLSLEVEGDLEVDGHHTIEDIGLLLGDAITEALGDRKGIERYGSLLLPMDETLAQIAVDVSGRSYLVYDCGYSRNDLGTLDVQNIKEFFKSLVSKSGITLHISVLYGENDHHKAEAIFKGVGRVFRKAFTITNDSIQSSKGVL